MVLDGFLTVLGGEPCIGRAVVLDMEGQLALSISFQTQTHMYVCIYMNMHVNVCSCLYGASEQQRDSRYAVSSSAPCALYDVLYQCTYVCMRVDSLSFLNNKLMLNNTYVHTLIYKIG